MMDCASRRWMTSWMGLALAAGLAPSCANSRTEGGGLGSVGQRMVVSGLRVDVHHAEDGSATNSEIKPVLRIVNAGSTEVVLSALTLRYYFTNEGVAPSSSTCHWAALGCGNLVHQVYELPEPVGGADRYLEVRFAAGAGSLSPGASTSDIKLALHKSDWSAYDENDDYSYVAGAVSWTAAAKVALFHDSDIVWGTPAGPGSIPPGGAGGGDEKGFTLQLPMGVGLHSVALGASEAVTVGDGVLATASIPGAAVGIASVGMAETNIGTDTELPGDITSVGPVKVRDRAVVQGSVTTSSEFRHDSVWEVIGGVVEGADLMPVTTYTWTVDFPPSDLSYLVGPQQTRSLSPGAYANIDVHPSGVLELSSGVYTMNALRTESDSTMRLDVSGGPIFIYVREALTHRGRLEGADAGELFIGFRGTGMADIDAPFQGTVVAPNAHLRLSPVDGSGHEGSFFGRRVEKDARNPLVFTPFGHWDMILPPEIRVECLTRSAAGYGAGVFGYENRLDIPVAIPEGPRNWLSATRLHKGPLEAFLPGEHHDVYSIPFRGDALEWSLSGNLVRVDDSARRCTLGDYEVVDVGTVEPLQPLPQALAALAVPLAPLPPLVAVAEPPPTADIESVLRAAAGGVIGGAGEVLSSEENGGFNVLITSVGFDDEDSCTVGSTDVDLKVSAYRGTPHAQSEEIEVYQSGWNFFDHIDDFLGFPGLAGLFDDRVKHINHTVFVPLYDDQTVATMRIDLLERDSAWCGGDDHYARLDLVIDPATLGLMDGTQVSGSDAHWYTVTPSAEILSEGGDPSRPLHCGRGRSSWGICFQVVPAVPPKLCADFPAQFLDSAGGEDHLASIDVQRIPASFAEVELNVVGGIHPFTPRAPGDFVVLDGDGCIPREYTPTVAQLTPASSDFLVTFVWRGSLMAALGEEGPPITVHIDRVPGDGSSDTWAACNATGEPFQCMPSNSQCVSSTGSNANDCEPYPVPCPAGGGTPGMACYQPAASVHTIAEGSWSTGENRATFATADPERPTAISNAAALAAHLLRQHVHRGIDLGIAPGVVHLWPESIPAFFTKSPYHDPRGTETERYVHARPVWTSVEADGSLLPHETDSARKFVLAHELTHAMQELAAGHVGNGNYALRVRNPDGTTTVSRDPEGFPVECRCNHIGNEFLPWHCLNSVEPVGGASGEGYAHAMGVRAFNDPSDPAEDCWFVYVKDSLVPPAADGSCPSGTLDPEHPECIRIGSPEGEALVNERYPLADDRARLRSELANWYFVKSPARIRCSEASKWRNRYCATAVSSALAGDEEAAVEYLGTELDWLQFFWGLSRDDASWTPTEFLALQRAACAERICSATEWSPECEPQRCNGGVIGAEAWRLYDELATAGRPESVAVTQDQWNELLDVGDVYGVSTNLDP